MSLLSSVEATHPHNATLHTPWSQLLLPHFGCSKIALMRSWTQPITLQKKGGWLLSFSFKSKAECPKALGWFYYQLLHPDGDVQQPLKQACSSPFLVPSSTFFLLMFFAKVRDLPRSHGDRSEIWGWCDRERGWLTLYWSKVVLTKPGSSSQVKHLFPLEDRKRDKHGMHPPYTGMSLGFWCLLGTDQGPWLGWGLAHLFSGELATWGCCDYTWSREHVPLPGTLDISEGPRGPPAQTDWHPSLPECVQSLNLTYHTSSFPGHFSKERRTVSPIHRLLGNGNWSLPHQNHWWGYPFLWSGLDGLNDLLVMNGIH